MAIINLYNLWSIGIFAYVEEIAPTPITITTPQHPPYPNQKIRVLATLPATSLPPYQKHISYEIKKVILFVIPHKMDTFGGYAMDGIYCVLSGVSSHNG